MKPRRAASRLTPALLAIAVGAPGLAAQSGSLVVDTLQSPAVGANLLGEPGAVEVAVYTPPGYGDDRTRYPVLYLLHGITGTFRDWTGGSYQGLQIHAELDALIGSGELPPLIVVMPTAMNRYQGSFYVDSPVSGRWAEFMTSELIRWVDGRYRTVARPKGRGVAGHSMGGFGAMTLAMDHPGVFGAVYALSPCCLELTDDFGPANPAWSTLSGFSDPEDVQAALSQGNFYPVAITGFLTAVLPSPGAPPLYIDLPYRPDGTGFLTRVEPTHSRFLSAFPIERLDERAEALRGLRGLALDAGHDDQFAHIAPGARAFSQRLAELEVPHSFELYRGDHRNRIRARLRAVVLPFFVRHLEWDG